jgi:DNA-binding IclR family transcriptional regulator
MPKQTKSEIVRNMLAHPSGTTLTKICKRTNWQRHTVHAFLSGLRKTGLIVDRKGQGRTATYRLIAAAEAAK